MKHINAASQARSRLKKLWLFNWSKGVRPELDSWRRAMQRKAMYCQKKHRSSRSRRVGLGSSAAVDKRNETLMSELQKKCELLQEQLDQSKVVFEKKKQQELEMQACAHMKVIMEAQKVV